MQAADRFSLSVATFYNDYDKIRSAEPGTGPFGLPITLANGVRGETYGVELAAVQRMTDWWRLRGGYTHLEKNLEIAPGFIDLNGATAESNDPENQIVLQSSMDLPAGWQLDTIVRYVDRASRCRKFSDYVTLDARLAWRPNPHLEIALVGQNLLDEKHLEFLPTSPTPRDIERSLFGRIAWQY